MCRGEKKPCKGASKCQGREVEVPILNGAGGEAIAGKVAFGQTLKVARE